MTETLFPTPAWPSVAVHGEAARFPVRRIFCVGRNYAAHAAEMGVEVDREAPFYFTKSALTILPTGQTYPYPPGTEDFHYEMEFVVAIGKPAFRVGVDQAMEAVYGYATGLDMTRRDLQLAARAKQRPWDLGKDVEGSSVISAITPAAQFTVSDQPIRLSVDGEVKQDFDPGRSGLVGAGTGCRPVEFLSPRTRRPDLYRHACRGWRGIARREDPRHHRRAGPGRVDRRGAGMKFYGYFRSSSAYRCRIAFNLKKIRPETEFVNLRDGQQRSELFRRLNPQGLVPALDTGEGLLTQSLAIIEWLDETHPAPPLLPADAVGRAHVRAFAQIIACEVHPLHNLRVLNFIKQNYGQDQAGADAWCRHWIGDGLAACEAIAAEQSHGGAFTFGDAPGLADICLMPQMFAADRFGLDLSPYGRLREIRSACDALPAFADARPANQPDAI